VTQSVTHFYMVLRSKIENIIELSTFIFSLVFPVEVLKTRKKMFPNV